MTTTRRAATAVTLAALVLGAAACSDDKKDDTSPGSTTAVSSSAATTTTATAGGATTAPPASSAPTTAGTGSGGDSGEGVTAAGISPARCEENKKAGKITYLSSFDFAASASILDVVVAKEKGYFDTMCLDVELKPSFSTVNYPLVASGQAQFSSAGNFTEILNFSKDGAAFVAIVDYGKTPIEGLLVKPGEATTVADLKGKTLGVKGDIPPSIVALLAKNGLKRGTDYKEVLLDGFDPKVHLQQPVAGFPVYKSNEPGQLDAAGVPYTLFDPTKEGIPGSFGLIYTSKDFHDKHPTATADFARAALKGMEDAIADPAGAVALSVKQINAAGNQNFLTQEGETYRWKQELAEVMKGVKAGQPVGVIDPFVFMDELQAYTDAGVFPNGAPSMDGSFDPDMARLVYGQDGKVIWPKS